MNDKTPAEMAKEIREFFNQKGFIINEKLLELIHAAVEIAKSTHQMAKEKCPNCDNRGTEYPHSCPYACEIHDDCSDDHCNCCDSCTQNCRDDI